MDPITREEKYLNAILSGDTSDLPTPITREEMYLYNIAMNGGGGGGETLYADNPIGTILAFGGSDIPTGWHLCDGSALSRTTYKDLFDVIGTNFGVGDGSTTFNLPDLRGEFLRGAGNNSHSGQGNGANLGEHQDATNHLYITGKNSIGIQCGTDTEASDLQTNYDTQSAVGAGKYFANPSPSYAQLSQTFTSRPTNTSVNYIIKMSKTGVPDDFQSKVNEAVVENNTYSTEERVVGTWIDGKPIYRKVFTGLDFGGTTGTWAKLSDEGVFVPNIDTLCDFRILRKNSAMESKSTVVYYGMIATQLNDELKYYFTSPAIHCDMLSVEYTKTTD